MAHNNFVGAGINVEFNSFQEGKLLVPGQVKFVPSSLNHCGLLYILCKNQYPKKEVLVAVDKFENLWEPVWDTRSRIGGLVGYQKDESHRRDSQNYC